MPHDLVFPPSWHVFQFPHSYMAYISHELGVLFRKFKHNGLTRTFEVADEAQLHAHLRTLYDSLLCAPVLDGKLMRPFFLGDATAIETARYALKFSLFGRYHATVVLRLISKRSPNVCERGLTLIDPIAGSGLDAMVFAEAADVLSLKLHVHAGDLHPKCPPVQTLVPVRERRSIETLREGVSEARARGSDSLLLLIWQYEIDEGVLEEFTGRWVLWIGEREDGCTYGYSIRDFRATGLYGERLKGAFVVQPWLKHKIPMLQHDGINDRCVLFERNPRFTPALRQHYSEHTAEELEAEWRLDTETFQALRALFASDGATQ